MSEEKLSLLSGNYFKEYSKKAEVLKGDSLSAKAIKEGFSVKDFEHYLVASSVFSSKIEGNTLDLNSFMRNRNDKAGAKRKEVREIEDLVSAYKFAAKSKVTEINFLKAHAMLSKTLLEKASERGKYRKAQVGVFDGDTGKPVYMAVEGEHVKAEIKKLFTDIKALSQSKLNKKEVLYYASMIHLWIAMIHPFADGNGRTARLLEKWFIASHLGKTAWAVNSEKYYWDNRPAYYQNIALGYNYYALKWERCLPFLLMLPKAIKN